MSEEKCFCHLNGYKVKDADARVKIGELEDRKVNKTAVANVIYGTDNNGNPKLYEPNIYAEGLEGKIPLRTENGHIIVPTKTTQGYHATSKEYVDNKFSESQKYVDNALANVGGGVSFEEVPITLVSFTEDSAVFSFPTDPDAVYMAVMKSFSPEGTPDWKEGFVCLFTPCIMTGNTLTDVHDYFSSVGITDLDGAGREQTIEFIPLNVLHDEMRNVISTNLKIYKIM